MAHTGARQTRYITFKMNSLSLIALALAAAAPSRAQTGPAARIAAFVERAPEMNGAELPPAAAVPVPQSAAVQAPPSSASVVPAGLWATLQAPDAATLAALSSRIPGLDAGAVRVLPLAAADALLDAAAARGQSPLDFFTDPAFRGDAAYYLDQAAVAALFARYDIRGLTPASGTTTDGRPFAVQGFVVGGGRIDILYNLDQFILENPLFPGHKYKLAERVTERIQGPGDMTIDGIWVRFGPMTPKILRIVRLSPTKSRVETNYGSLEKPIYLIRRL
jgi:hypothetical protein